VSRNTASATAPLAPGSTIGILGGGQLGRMTAMAAAQLGYRCHIFAPETDCPAAQVSAAATIAAYEDRDALAAFAAAVDVVTFEFENVPHESVELLSRAVPVRPGWDALRISQDRGVEKDFIAGLGIATTPYARAGSVGELRDVVETLGRPSVLKTTRMGYDGKGQVLIGPDSDLDEAWVQMASGTGILEAFVDLEKELSVIVARGLDGALATYPAVENVHRNHILHTTTAPAAISEALAAEAQGVAERIAQAMDLTGLLAVEMFVTRDGRLLVNEIAPRPHNSGHWTMDACVCGQFEQLVRAVCGLPLGSTVPHSDAVMTNLIGDDVNAWAALAAEPGACLHLYGKAETRPGRKMGHVTRLTPKGKG